MQTNKDSYNMGVKDRKNGKIPSTPIFGRDSYIQGYIEESIFIESLNRLNGVKYKTNFIV